MLDIYKLTASFPSDERFSLVNQIARAAVSIPANIAEGHGRKSTNAFLNHLSIANGPLMELETHIQISFRLGYLSHEQLSDSLRKTSEIGKMINGLRTSLSLRATKRGSSESRIQTPES